MESIFHEKQEGSLCAQHCLNALLQGPYFTPVDLATLAQTLDDEERLRMAESGVDSEDYRRFLEQPSGNYDDSGYFSVQVISSALEVWGLELVPYNSTEPRALEAQKCPANMKAFICNYRDHWFTIRRLGRQWFNLNSLLSQPQLISDTYLAMFLAQLQQEGANKSYSQKTRQFSNLQLGIRCIATCLIDLSLLLCCNAMLSNQRMRNYCVFWLSIQNEMTYTDLGYSIFVAFGIFPECEADNLLRLVPAVQMEKPQMVQKMKPFASTGIRLGGASSSAATEDEDAELQRALRLSLGQASDDDASSSGNIDTRTNSGEMRRMVSQNSQDDDEDLQRALCLSLQKETVDVDNDALELERALQMSLECCDSTPPTTDVTAEEIRRRRLNYLDARSRRPAELTPKPSSESKVNT